MEIVLKLGILLLVLSLAGIVLRGAWRYFRDRRRWYLRRKAYFEQREPVSPDEWIARFAPHLAGHSALVQRYLEVIGDCLEIDWTRLRPEDRFTSEINPWDRPLLSPHPAEDLEIALEIWLEDHEVRVPRGTVLPDRLGEHLAQLIEFAEQRRARSGQPA